MVFFNWATMQMAAKIVYYGPGLCGKTTNLSFIYAKTSPGSRGEMVSLETESDRTLFFDLLPIEVGTIGGFKTRLQLYTVPGQVFYNTTRKLVLKGVDGVVFVADSQRPMREANIESFNNLRENLKELGLDLDDLPLVLQYNKRDLQNILTIEELNADLNPDGKIPFFEASAIQGNGVFETLKEITKLTLKKLRKRMASSQEESRSTGPRVQASRPAAPQPAQRPAGPVPAPAAPTPAPAGAVSAAALARAAEEGVGAIEEAQEPAPAEAAAPPAEQPAPAATPETPTLRMKRPEEAEAPSEPEPAEEIEEIEEADEIEEIGEAEEAAEAAPPEEAAAAEPAEPVEETAPESGEESGEEPVVEFATEEAPIEEVSPPPVKRVHVDSQMDILAELENLRKQATSGQGSYSRTRKAAEVDLDSLLGQGLDEKKEVRRKLQKQLNSDIFQRMRSLQMAIRIQDEHGDTITTLDPVSFSVGDASSLRTVLLTFTLDLENLK